MIPSLYQLDRYSGKYDWLISLPIREYDVAKANITILLWQGRISEEEYDYYSHLPKLQREKSIGLLLKNNTEMSKGLMKGFVDAREVFFKSNSIDTQDVLFINRDSVTLINTIPKVTEFDIGSKSHTLKFELKDQYTSFYRIFLVDGSGNCKLNIEFLYYFDGYKETYRLKGGSGRMSSLHTNGMLDFILSVANDAQAGRVLDTLRMINSAYRMYTAHAMEIDYYREFNDRSQFKLLSTPTFNYYLETVPPSIDRSMLDISFNAGIFRLFYRIFTKIYFDTENKKDKKPPYSRW